MLDRDDAQADNDDWDAPEAPAEGGPFGVAPVDRIVYRKTEDAPELRAAAAYVPITAAHRNLPSPAPVAPSKQDFNDWTPAVESNDLPVNPEPYTDPELRSVSSTARVVFTVLAVAIPVLLVGGAILLGLSISGVL